MGVSSYKFRSSFKLQNLLTGRYIRLRQAKLFTRRGVFVDLQKRIFIKHLLDFLTQLKR